MPTPWATQPKVVIAGYALTQIIGEKGCVFAPAADRCKMLSFLEMHADVGRTSFCKPQPVDNRRKQEFTPL